MTTNYYSQKKFLAKVDKKDNVIAPVERWQAHQRAVLHRGFTVVLIYNNQLILQQRKHPAFDGLYDLSFSSHPIYVDNQLQTMEEAINQTLKREWNLEKTDLKTDLKFLDKFYYRARDPKTIYTEHEIDYLYLAELKKLPQPNLDFAYGYKLIKQKPLSNFKFPTSSFGLRGMSQISNLKTAPWVKKIIENKFLQAL